MNVIYKISTNIDGKIYIGSSSKFEERKRQHFNLLKRGKHHSTYLQNFYNKYNCKIIFDIIEIVEKKEDIWNREQYWMSFYSSFKPQFGFNCSVNPRSSKSYNPIIQYSLSGTLLKIFNNIQEAKEWMKNNNHPWSDGPYKRLQVGGFQWKLCLDTNPPSKIPSILTFYCYYDKKGIYKGYHTSTAFCNRKSNLTRALQNGLMYDGYYWKLSNDENLIDKKINIRVRNTTAKKVILIKDEKREIFNSLTEAAKFLNTSVYSVSRVLSKSTKLTKYKTIKGFDVQYGN